LSCLYRLAGPEPAKDLTDTDLLERFRSRGEEAAFTLLMQRHGPAVLRVCQRVFGDAHEAEDAFQATFLVLVRKAGSIRKQQSLASWLYGVAHHIAGRARAQANQRRIRARAAVSPVTSPSAPDMVSQSELHALLDEEVGQLPDRYRAPLVLCCLEGKTHEQAARELGWPRSSVTARLERAREQLRLRLTRRGYSVTAGLPAAVLTEQTASAAIPAQLTLATVRLASQVIAGKVASTTAAAALADSLVRGMTMTKLVAALGLLLGVGLAAGVGALILPRVVSSYEPDQPGAPPALANASDTPLPAGAVAWLGTDPLRVGEVEIALTADGKKVIALTSAGVVHTIDAQTGSRIERKVLGDRQDFFWQNAQLSLSAHGSTAAILEDRWSRLRVWDVPSGQQRFQSPLPKVGEAIALHALSSDGNSLLEHYRRQRKYSIELCALQTETPREIGVVRHSPFNICVTPDGKRSLAAVRDEQGRIVLVCFDVAGATKL
jgi:RNA polymerase sigma factor (sigma-70 family)